ncbi:MAG: ABC transporter ATP-binding protein [Planctomycetota bacterium]|jgi:phospholipid/cholesterol/gamma-HCH transport system ATP-binding protein
MTDDLPAIEVRDLHIAFGPKTVLQHVTFDVRPGEIFFVGGNSGCGKSTLFKHIVGLHRPRGGTIRVGGRDAVDISGAARRDMLRTIGISYQGGALFGSMTTLENVMLPLREFTELTPAQRKAVAMTKLRLVGLGDAAGRLPSELSGGMQKRAAVARALALDPELLFLDEPSAGLDPLSSHDLDTLIATLSRLLGTTFVIVSHELASIFAIADRLVLLDAARRTQVAIGPPAELRDGSEDPWVRRFLSGGRAA